MSYSEHRDIFRQVLELTLAYMQDVREVAARLRNTELYFLKRLTTGYVGGGTLPFYLPGGRIDDPNTQFRWNLMEPHGPDWGLTYYGPGY